MANQVANELVRRIIKNRNVKHWEVASMLGVDASTLCRWLRTELCADKEEMIINAITKIVLSKGGDNNEYEHNADFPAENENGTAVDGTAEAG